MKQDKGKPVLKLQGMHMECKRMLLFIICLGIMFAVGADTTNTIDKSNFNFGHQSGYMYSVMDSAYFDTINKLTFRTGFLSYYTSDMPMVRNPEFKKRLMLLIPLHLQLHVNSIMSLEMVLTDLFIEFPYKNIHNTGGKSPRFSTKLRLLKESRYLPAIAFTMGCTFSSAKPYTIWDNNHNYDESNGLAGAGTGVADYFLIFTLSKRIDSTFSATCRIGLAPIGSPVEYVRGSGQADEIPYGLSIQKRFLSMYSVQAEIAGMYNGLRGTLLAHYSVARIMATIHKNNNRFCLNIERGLTPESDDWVLGVYTSFSIKKR
jgi:hypothetical protein